MKETLQWRPFKCSRTPFIHQELRCSCSACIYALCVFFILCYLTGNT